MTTGPTRAQLRQHLVDTRIAGDVATGRDSNLTNIGLMLDRHPKYTFGLELGHSWTHDEVVALMSRVVGIDADPNRLSGPDTIDPDLTADALDRAREQLRRVVRAGGSVLFASGHPTGLMAMYQTLAVAVAAAGCRVLTPGDGAEVTVEHRQGRVLYVGNVAVLATKAHLMHTHRPEPMQTALEASDEWPDLVVADHAWAGSAAQAGLVTVGFADCNDPAMFVGEADGRVAVAVPLDDNVAPRHYAPLAAYLTADLAG